MSAGQPRRTMRALPITTASALLALALSLHPRASRAQTPSIALGDVALQQLEPSPAGDPFFSVASPSIGGHLIFRGHFLFDYAVNPLKLVGPSDTPIVASQGFLRANASFALFDRVLASVDIPAAVINTGEDPNVTGVAFHVPSGLALGDIRIGARVALLGPPNSELAPVGVALESALYVPSGDAAGYAGEGSVRATARAILGGHLSTFLPIVWSVNAGTMLRFSENPHSFTFGGAAALAFKDGMIRVGPEVFGAVPFKGALLSAPGATLQTGAKINAEALLGTRVRLLNRFELGLGGGVGLSDAIGTPSARFMALAAWSPSASSPPTQNSKAADKDNDRIADALDACPTVSGEASADKRFNGCPPDGDKDGVLNASDACPNEPGQKSLDLTINGCPPDRDGDRVADARDNCPDTKGLPSKIPGRNGCPVDRDGDGIPDLADACPDQKGERSPDRARNGCPNDIDGDGLKPPQDACPYERGAPDPDPNQNGCPKYVRVTENEIVLLKPIRFERYGKEKKDTRISAELEEILREVKDVLDQHPEIEQIEVQGHADGGGSSESKYNMDLSKERANRVWWWLVQVGIPEGKLVDKGYGDSMPIGDNNTEEGQAMNRRVQLIIVKKKP